MFSKTIVSTMAIMAILISVANATGLTGTVTSAESGEAIAGAVIKLKGSDLGTVTDGSGRYRLADIPSGDATLVASVIGYHVAFRSVDAAKAGTVDFALTPKLLQGQDVIVTATRAEAGQTPVAFTNITNDDIADKYFA
ncbi:MAG: carboxypeptidase-like regulatory domain-containing protein, partial [candidate division Zixibacteria bacterium]